MKITEGSNLRPLSYMLCFHAMSIEIVAKSCSSIIMPTSAVLEQLAVLVYFAIGDTYTQPTFTLPCSHHHHY